MTMKYVKIMQLGVKRVFVYRAGILLHLFSSIISIFILQRFWLALYGDDPISYVYMANYAIVAQILGIIYRFKSPNNLATRIRTGAISVELLRPWEYINAMMFEDVGAIVGNLCSSGLIMFAVGRLLFGLEIPTLPNILFFFVSAFLGFLVMFLVKILVAMICFWVVEAWSLMILIDVVINLLSGQFLPSWLMPEWMEKIMNALPFVWIYQKPVSVFVDGAVGNAAEFGEILLLQFGWVVVLYLFAMWLWRVAVGKLSVQGG